MDFIDYYQILGLGKSATQDEIKKAYRKLARQFHPDVNPSNADANKKFQQINEANEVLSDPEKRKKYDKYGKDWQHGEEYEKMRQQQAQNPFGGSFGGFGSGGTQYHYSGGDEDYSDFFASMFGSGGGRQRTGKFRGQDVQAAMQVNLSDVFKTEKQTLNINGKPTRITIPAGIEDGQTLTLKGFGGPGANGGPNGDLLVTFNVVNNTAFKRKGADLYIDKEIDLYTALLGGDAVIETLHGKIKLKIKPVVQNDAKTRVAGKGFPVFKKEDQFGDLYVVYKVRMPERLTEEEKEIFTNLAKKN